MWYWQRTYMHKSGIPIDEFLVFKINCTIYGFFFRIKLSDTSAFANKLSTQVSDLDFKPFEHTL